MITSQSFAQIAKVNTDQLQNLPGFGQVKVKNIKNAFEKPFRNNATNSLAMLASQAKNNDSQASSTKPTNPPETQDKGSQPPVAPAAARPSTSSRPPREPSPVWDIELDLSPTAESGPLPEILSSPARNKSPEWDIELDLN